jgi:hypothetical protein
LDETYALQGREPGDHRWSPHAILVYSPGKSLPGHATVSFGTGNDAGIWPHTIAADTTVQRNRAEVRRLLLRAVANAEAQILWYQMQGDESMAALYTQVAAWRRKRLKRHSRC